MAIREVLEFIVKGDAKGAIDAFRGVEKAADGAEQTSGRFGGMFDKLTDRFPVVGRAASKFGIDASNAGALAGTAATAAASAIGAFAVKSVQAYQQTAGEILKFQRISGTSAEEASRWVEVAGDYEVSTDQMSAAIGRLGRQAATAPEELARLGVEIARNADGSVNLEKTMLAAAEAFRLQTDDAKRAELGNKLFGKSWQDLVPLLVKGSDELKASLDGVSDSKILSDKDLKEAEEFRLALDDLKGVSEDLMIQVGKGLVPALSDLAQAAKDAAGPLEAITKPIGGLSGAVQAVSKGFTDALNPFAAWKRNLDELRGKTDDTAKSLDLQAKAQDHAAQFGASLADVFEEEAEASDSLGASLGKQAGKLDEVAKAIKEANDKADDYLQTTQDLYVASLDYQGLLDHFPDKINDLKVAHEEVTRAERDHGSGSEQLRLAHVKQADAIRGVQLGFIEIAKKAEDAAVQQANLEGRTLTATEKADAQKKALQELALAHPEVKAAIEAYIRDGLDPLLVKSDEAGRRGTAAANATRDAWLAAGRAMAVSVGGGASDATAGLGGAILGGADDFMPTTKPGFGGSTNSLSAFGGATGVTVNVTLTAPLVTQQAAQWVADQLAVLIRTNGVGALPFTGVTAKV